jgi:hypothetical protein
MRDVIYRFHYKYFSRKQLSIALEIVAECQFPCIRGSARNGAKKEGAGRSRPCFDSTVSLAPIGGEV